ncbi:hypothetical protein KC357_g9286 [Hortaea werneckii]|nr:hypothetical protein KC357_g9286 [Hortaea werneckii]
MFGRRGSSYGLGQEIREDTDSDTRKEMDRRSKRFSEIRGKVDASYPELPDIRAAFGEGSGVEQVDGEDIVTFTSGRDAEEQHRVNLTKVTTDIQTEVENNSDDVEKAFERILHELKVTLDERDSIQEDLNWAHKKITELEEKAHDQHHHDDDTEKLRLESRIQTLENRLATATTYRETVDGLLKIAEDQAGKYAKRLHDAEEKQAEVERFAIQHNKLVDALTAKGEDMETLAQFLLDPHSSFASGQASKATKGRPLSPLLRLRQQRSQTAPQQETTPTPTAIPFRQTTAPASLVASESFHMADFESMVTIDPLQQTPIKAFRSKPTVPDDFVGGEDGKKKWNQWLCSVEMALREHTFKTNTDAVLFIIPYLKDDAYRQLSPRFPTLVNRYANINCYTTVTQLLVDMQNRWQSRTVVESAIRDFSNLVQDYHESLSQFLGRYDALRAIVPPMAESTEIFQLRNKLNGWYRNRMTSHTSSFYSLSDLREFLLNAEVRYEEQANDKADKAKKDAEIKAAAERLQGSGQNKGKNNAKGRDGKTQEQQGTPKDKKDVTKPWKDPRVKAIHAKAEWSPDDCESLRKVVQDLKINSAQRNLMSEVGRCFTCLDTR